MTRITGAIAKYTETPNHFIYFTCVKMLCRTRHNTVGTFIIQQDANKLQDILRFNQIIHDHSMKLCTAVYSITMEPFYYNHMNMVS